MESFVLHILEIFFSFFNALRSGVVDRMGEMTCYSYSWICLTFHEKMRVEVSRLKVKCSQHYAGVEFYRSSSSRHRT